ncbi:MAG: FtsX-like permease family protein [bacterium]
MNITELKVGFFLAYRQIKRSNFWITSLIVLVMMVTFLNLVVISGILIGLIAGSSNDFRSHYSGDVFIKPKTEYKVIRDADKIVGIAKGLPEVVDISTRYLLPVSLENDYKKELSENKSKNISSTILAGITPADEDKVTGLSSFLVEGDFLSEDDTDKILVGSSLLSQYSDALSQNTIKNVKIGSKLRMTIGDNFHDVIVKGIIKIKVGDVSQRIFMNKKHMLNLIQLNKNDASEIAITIDPKTESAYIKESLQNSNIDKSALVQTWEEAQGKFFKDLSSTFTILGNVIGTIGLVVASITIFIVIFINAISRKKFIGILKGIGVSGSTIRYSYLFQSIFYATIGSLLGLMLLYGILVPYFDKNPIDFPFSDGILAVTAAGTTWRLGLLFLATLIAGFLPAQIVIRRNTLDSILGR